jgi:hypothetical protein
MISLHEIEIAQTAGTAVAAHDLLDRAAEVDVEEVRAIDLLHERGGLAHRHRVGAEDLDADGAFLVVEPEVLVGAAIVAANPLGRNELGHDDVRAIGAAETPERRLADARLGREEERDLAAPEQVEIGISHNS